MVGWVLEGEAFTFIGNTFIIIAHYESYLFIKYLQIVSLSFFKN